MKLPVSNKTGSFNNKPHIKKGFYPAKLMGYKATKNDGTPIEGKHGEMIILDFAIFKPVPEGETPSESMIVIEDNKSTDVMLDKFVYVSYKDKKTNELRTSLTPNSKPTETFKSLGWKPDFEKELELDVDSLIGNWAEVLVDDYKIKDKDNKEILTSSIGDVNPYEGKAPSEETNKKAEETKEKSKPKDVKKTIKNKELKEKVSELTPEIEEKIKQLKGLKDDGLLTQEGYNKAMESLGVNIE